MFKIVAVVFIGILTGIGFTAPITLENIDLGVARNPSLKSERSCGSRWGGAGQPRLVVYDLT